jgi:hypothetical protein
MKNKISIVIIIIFCLFTSSVGFNSAKADYREINPSNFAKEKTATLFLSDPQIISGGKYSMKLMVDTGGQSANAILSSLNFPKNEINAEGINIENSVCGYFIENDFDNEQGDLNIVCGKPYPGFSGTAEVAEIVFTKKTFGLSRFIFSSATVLANDGYATNILLEAKDKNISF